VKFLAVIPNFRTFESSRRGKEEEEREREREEEEDLQQWVALLHRLTMKASTRETVDSIQKFELAAKTETDRRALLTRKKLRTIFIKELKSFPPPPLFPTKQNPTTKRKEE